jgi:uncharacterized LabA/DUF88 family protein
LEAAIMDRVGLFVDGANMFYAQKEIGWHIDFRLVCQYFFQNRERGPAYYFMASPSPGDQVRIEKYRRFKNALTYLGFSVVDKELKIIKDASGEIVKIKGNLDIDLVFKMLTQVGSYEEAVLMGVDSDYVPIIEHLRNLGKTVVIVGDGRSTSMEVRNSATKFIDLGGIRKSIEKTPNISINAQASVKTPPKKKA